MVKNAFGFTVKSQPYLRSRRGTDMFSMGHEVKGIKPRRHFRNTLRRMRPEIIKTVEQFQKSVKVEALSAAFTMPVQAAFSINVFGVKELTYFMERQIKERLNAMNQSIIKATLATEREVKLSIMGRKAEPKSHDTGRFVNSVQHKIGLGEGKVYSELDYAKYLEYGSSPHFVAPRMKKALHWKAKATTTG